MSTETPRPFKKYGSPELVAYLESLPPDDEDRESAREVEMCITNDGRFRRKINAWITEQRTKAGQTTTREDLL